MSGNKSHAKFALEHLVCELRALGVVVNVSNGGPGSYPALEYRTNANRDGAGGMLVADVDGPTTHIRIMNNLAARVSGVIRAHHELFYTLRTGA